MSKRRMRLNLVITVLATVILFFSAVSSVTALSLEPLSHTFDTSQSGRIRTFRVKNTQSQRISVRVRMTSRSLLPNGEEVRGPVDDEWLVFPRQMTLEPGTTQAVRVQYTGTDDVSVERAYRIVAEQLPVDFSGGDRQSGINLLFRYEGSVYVAPPGAAPDVVLVESSLQFEDGVLQGLLVRFENRGTAHAILNDLVFTISRSDAAGTAGNTVDEITIGEEDLAVLGGANLLAGARLEELIPLSKEWAEGLLNVRYDVDLLQ